MTHTNPNVLHMGACVMATETLVVDNVPADRLQEVIGIRGLDGWNVRAINVEPDGEYMVVFDRTV